MTTVHEQMTPEEQMQELYERILRLENTVTDLAAALINRDKVIAVAVLNHIKEKEILEEIIVRVTAAIEAEWSGGFLPELRREVTANLAETMQHMSADLERTLAEFKTSLTDGSSSKAP